METNDEQLLLTDLCARLPYGVMVHTSFMGHEEDMLLTSANIEAMLGDYGPVPIMNMVEDDINDGFTLENVKPYLRPMPSMTEEEKKEYESLIFTRYHEWDGHSTYTRYVEVEDTYYYIDWLNAHHFDYHGLIEKGLALEAPEGMYNIK